LNRIGIVVEKYNKHASDIIPVTFLTVMLWISAQGLIDEGVRVYAPTFPKWQISLLEMFLASFGLWFITLKKEEKNGDMEEKAGDANGTP
jgi:hypothetical protein